MGSLGWGRLADTKAREGYRSLETAIKIRPDVTHLDLDAPMIQTKAKPNVFTSMHQANQSATGKYAISTG